MSAAACPSEVQTMASYSSHSHSRTSGSNSLSLNTVSSPFHRKIDRTDLAACSRHQPSAHPQLAHVHSEPPFSET
jgi:hypothetical protein